MAQNIPPVADAGLPRYAAQDPVVLDGTGSYDPDGSGPLSYAWRQIVGPSVVISDANTATPTISGFVQTDAIQECEFELVVSDDELTSLPDTVKVVIVPAFSDKYRLPELKNDSFDPDKPTFIFFGGGDCVTGSADYARIFFDRAGWLPRVNAIQFPQGYKRDNIAGTPTYYQCGDMIIVYLSAVAPNYNQPIQTSGHSTGGMPAIDVGIHLNLTYADPRYAVNRVTFLDVGCRDSVTYSSCIERFIASFVDGEQCWVDGYDRGWFFHNALSALCPTLDHFGVPYWYDNSLTGSDMNQFNNGVVGGAYWSVAGPGKNLQLASTPDAQTYTFQWHGSLSSGYMDFYDESSYPGRLPEPVTLVGPVDVGDPNGAILTCEESENAVGYQLLFGSDSYRVMDYTIISDTPTPPDEIITTLPFEKTWWTVRVRDEYGSTIYADPKPIGIVNLSFPVENISTGKRYSYIQDAIDDAVFGDEIVLREGTYYENIYFKGKNLMVRSTNPDDPATVAATVINGGDQGSVVTFSGSSDGVSVLAGLTITGGTVGVSSCDASPTIRNCTIGSNGPNAIEFWQGYEPPTIIDCTILGQVVEVYEPTLVAYWSLDETEGTTAHDSAGAHDGTCHGEPLWKLTAGRIDGALAFDGIDDYVSTPFVLDPADGPFSVFAWIKGGAPGQAVISQTGGVNWLSADPSAGNLMTELRYIAGRVVGPPLWSETVITDGNWHRVGLTWDGSNRILYVDDVEVGKDTQTGLGSSEGGLYIGAGSTLDAAGLFSGLIDDVRIYNRAITP